MASARETWQALPRLGASDALNVQIGFEVSLHELATSTRMDVKTVDRYLGLLEGAYILRRLGGFSRNLRKEVAKSRKVFFLDLGIRNALLNAFQPPPLRDDMGRLWENYLVLERHNSPVPAAPVRSGLSPV